jgi:hypothetical protein
MRVSIQSFYQVSLIDLNLDVEIGFKIIISFLVDEAAEVSIELLAQSIAKAFNFKVHSWEIKYIFTSQ